MENNNNNKQNEKNKGVTVVQASTSYGNSIKYSVEQPKKLYPITWNDSDIKNGEDEDLYIEDQPMYPGPGKKRSISDLKTASSSRASSSTSKRYKLDEKYSDGYYSSGYYSEPEESDYENENPSNYFPSQWTHYSDSEDDESEEEHFDPWDPLGLNPPEDTYKDVPDWWRDILRKEKEEKLSKKNKKK